MKRIVVGTVLAVFALVPAIGWADCSVDHASMASSTPARPELAQTPAASKQDQPAVVKASVTKQVKPVAVKKTMEPAAKADGSTVVAKTN
ncbi:MAG TPA: hypothetical protein VF059_00785 [Casimicrobiaceae bacterium]